MIKEIKALMKAKKVTAYRLAQLTGISQAVLSYNLNGKTKMSAENYLLILKTLNEYETCK